MEDKTALSQYDSQEVVEIVKNSVQTVAMILKVIGLGFAIFNLLSYKSGESTIEFTEGEVYIKGIPMVRLFISWTILAFGSALDSIMKVIRGRKSD